LLLARRSLETSPNGGVPKGDRTPAARGLEDNPGEDGEIFTKQASYYKKIDTGEATRAVSALRVLALREAVKTLKDVKVTKEIEGGRQIDIGFTRKGLAHIQHDYFPDKQVQNIILSKMDEILKSTEYIHSAADRKNNTMIRRYHYFLINLFGDNYRIAVRELDNNQIYIYSMVKED
jgi:hypothetical protein